MTQRQHRGKRKDNGEWVEGWYLVDDQWKDPRHSIWTRKSVGDFLSNDMMEVDPDTVGQYIGREDEKGEKLFDGMPIMFTNLTLGRFTDNEKWLNGEIAYNNETASYYIDQEGFMWNLSGSTVIAINLPHLLNKEG